MRSHSGPTLSSTANSLPSQDSDDDAIRTAAEAIRDKKAHIRLNNQMKNKLQNRPVIPRKVQTRTLSDMTRKLAEAGYDPSNLEERARVLAKARGLLDSEGRKRSAGEMDVDGSDAEGDWGDEGEGDESMEVDGDGVSRKRAKTSIVNKGKRIPGTDRQVAGLKDTSVRSCSRFCRVCCWAGSDPAVARSQEATKAVELRHFAQRHPNRMAKASESDRHIRTKMPRHLCVLSAFGVLVWQPQADPPRFTQVLWKEKGRKDEPSLEEVLFATVVFAGGPRGASGPSGVEWSGGRMARRQLFLYSIVTPHPVLVVGCLLGASLTVPLAEVCMWSLLLASFENGRVPSFC